MVIATESLIESLDRLVKAWKSGDYRAAGVTAEHLELVGEILALRPEFRERFMARTKTEPRDALHILSEFLDCACEFRLEAEKHGHGAAQVG